MHPKSLDSNTYILGQSPQAEYRLELLNEIMKPRMFYELEKHVSFIGKKVLNVGCGSGHFEADLDTLTTDTQFYSIDINPQRIEEARARIEKHAQGRNQFVFDVKDITKDPLPEQQYDIISSRFVLSHLPNPEKLLEKMLQNLAPSGLIILQELAMSYHDFRAYGLTEGYDLFANATQELQMKHPNFRNVGFILLEYLIEQGYKIISTFIDQSVLYTAKEKAILRLGVEDAAEACMNHYGQEKFEQSIEMLKAFENDPKSYGLHLKAIGIIAQRQ